MQVNPGLLPLSHKGVCCIDCVDKIEQIENCIIEVIERKQLSVAKKGGFDTFVCDTTILASAEPRNNKLTANKSVLDNFLIDECLLNKFDLVVLFVEEDKKKQSVAIRKELGIATDPFLNRSKTDHERVERVADRIKHLTDNIDELLAQAQESDGGSCGTLD